MSDMKEKRADITEYCASTKGFTLIELIVALAVMSVLVSTCYSLFFAGQRTYKTIYDNSQQQHEARIAMSYLNVKIRQNDYITPSGDHSVSVVTDPVSGGKYLQVIGTPTDYIYNDGSGSLRVTQDSTKIFDSGETLIAEGLDSISITSPDASIIDIEIVYGGGNELTETIVLRTDAG